MLLFDDRYSRPPAAILPETSTRDLRTLSGAEYLLIYHDQFADDPISQPWLLRLDSLRRASFNGSVDTIRLSTIYEQFNGGIASPVADPRLSEIRLRALAGAAHPRLPDRRRPDGNPQPHPDRQSDLQPLPADAGIRRVGGGRALRLRLRAAVGYPARHRRGPHLLPRPDRAADLRRKAGALSGSGAARLQHALPQHGAVRLRPARQPLQFRPRLFRTVDQPAARRYQRQTHLPRQPERPGRDRPCCATNCAAARCSSPTTATAAAACGAAPN